MVFVSEDLFGNPVFVHLNMAAPRKKSVNPMLKWNGKTEGRKCKECVFCYSVQFANKYYKCDLRAGEKADYAPDHRANWEACGRFEAKIKEVEND